MISVAVIDDEISIRDQLVEYINTFGRDNNIDFTIVTFSDGMEFVESKKLFDLLFIDIQMGIMSGLELAKHIRKTDNNCMIIFVTNMLQFAINGYEVNAYDFIIKPLTYTLFEKRLRRAVNVLLNQVCETIIISANREKIKLRTDDIYYVEAINHKLYYHTASGIYEEWNTVIDIVNKLAPYGFALCNSGYLVNLKYCEKIKEESVYVKGEELKISRRKKKDFIDALTKYIRF